MRGLFKKLFGYGRRAPRTDPDDAVLQQAGELQRTGDLDGARVLCLDVLARRPDHAPALCLMGLICGQTGRLDEALSCLRQAVSRAPHLVDAHIGLGNVCVLLGDMQRAEASYRAALDRDSQAATANYNLGLLLKDLRRYDEAVGHLDRARFAAPDFPEAIVECGRCLVLMERYQSAIALLEDAAGRFPERSDMWVVLGNAYLKMQDARRALVCYETAQRLGEADADFFCSLGMAQHELGLIREAEASYDRALDLRPDFPLARFHRALSRLIRGEYAGGWPDYELRLISEEWPRRAVSFPRWKGEPLGARVILVYGEQGIGDEIMFASCLPQIIGAAGRCVLECAPKLEHLFRRSFPGAMVYAARPDGSIPPEVRDTGIELESAVGSLPLYLRRSSGDFPRHDGFLKADSRRVAEWRERLAAMGPGLKVGISWRGGTHKTRSALRSIPLADLQPLLIDPAVRFVSLQYTDPTDELAAFAARHGIVIDHWPNAVADYEETAALVYALDAVVSVCTAVVHLTGALGKPVFVMAPYCPEWRYGFGGDTMPWYPSARIFRQPAPGTWNPVIARVGHELQRFMHSVSAGRPV